MSTSRKSKSAKSRGGESHDGKSIKSRQCKSATYSWEQHSFEQHRSRVRQATPTVNMKMPEYRPHVRYNAKRTQLERERQAQIARDNFILFKRLTDIMNGKLQRKYPITQAKSMCIKTR
ncbi:uncharacterized protein LOC106637838 [Copidosoma floridanum]|uniref:uncharacterized protein LOC106637838 n=1 Tax=Copidosoma floridanum TaxID=29053 RepID=UPI0006C97C36|nr:uncharacterized protein LOC106637838 [Copidosoma floridanum]